MKMNQTSQKKPHKFRDAKDEVKEDIDTESLAEEAKKIADKAKELTNFPDEKE